MRRIIQMFRTPDGELRVATFILVCSLFLLWGAFNGMIDVLNKHFQDSLHISKAESALVQAAWYSAYFLIALPSGWLARRIGYRGGILTGLGLAVVGSLRFIPAVQIHASKDIIFAGFLTALFVLGAGMTCLETVANPYTTMLGPVESAVTRINLAQTCNAVGWMIGPIIIGTFIMSKTKVANTSNAALYIPYLLLAGVVAILIVVFVYAPVPDLHAPEEAKAATGPREHARPLNREWHFILAIVAQFFYVAAQAGIFSFFINYVKDKGYSPAIPHWLATRMPAAVESISAGHYYITQYGATTLFSMAFGLFALGRLSGSVMLRFTRAHISLAAYAGINAFLMAIVILNGQHFGKFTLHLGWLAVGALMLSFFFMSIMYPTIFALGIRGLGEKTKVAAGYIVMSIVGGAIMPLFMGWLADIFSMRIGFAMPLYCFIVIALYGFFWKAFFARDMLPEETGPAPLAASH